MSELAKITNFVRSSSAGWWLDSEQEPVCVLVWPASGDISIKTDGTTGMRLSIPGNKVSGFSLDHSDSGYVIRVLFIDNSIPLPVGYTHDPVVARNWIAEVNTFYEMSLQLSSERHGPLASSTVVRSIFDGGSIYYLPGHYVPCADGRLMAWQEAFLLACQRIVKDEFRYNRLKGRPRDVEIIPATLIQPQDYGWLIDGLCFDDKSNARIMISLEMIFLFGERRSKINLIRMGQVRSFRFIIPSQFDAAPPKKAREPISENDFCALLNKITSQSQSKIATSTKDATESYLRSLITKQLWNTELHSIQASNDYDLLARQLGEGVPLAADTGVSNEVLALLAPDTRLSTRTFSVEYPQPIDIGMAVRADDPIWESICRKAWSQTKQLIAQSAQLLDDYNVFVKSARDAVDLVIDPIPRDHMANSE